MESRQSGGRRLSVGALLALATLIATTGCDHLKSERPPQTVTDLGCIWFQPIYLPEPDIAALSDATKDVIAAHNGVWESVCEMTPGAAE
jgi:hypothetical protein